MKLIRDPVVQETDTWKQALEVAGLGVWDWDLRTKITVYSESWCRMLGYQRSELPQNEDLFLLLVHPDDRERAIESGDRHLAGMCDSIETELRLQHRDGSWVWVLDRGAVVERDENGLPLRVMGVQTDITQQKEAERDASLMNERFQLALAASGTGIWHFDVGRKLSFWDAKTCEIFGLASCSLELDSETWHGFLHPDDRLETERRHLAAIESDDVAKLFYRIIRKDGEVRHVETLAKSVRSQGSAGYLVGTIRDATDEIRAGRALHAEKERYEITLGAISDSVISTDVAGLINFANPSASEMLSLEQGQLIGHNIFSLFRNDEFVRSVELDNSDGFQGGATLEIHSELYRCKSRPILSPTGDSWGTVYTFQNISEETRRQQQLAYAAHHDALSGLYNRIAFDEALEKAIKTAAEVAFAVLYLDLDHFKALNDFAGHAAGDDALKAIASNVSKLLPQDAIFARLGGDEFAILITDPDVDAVQKIAADSIEAIQAIELNHSVGGHRLGCSIGIAIVNDPSISASDALAQADDACYAAKSSGRNRFSFFTKHESAMTTGLSAAREVAELTEALEESRVILYGQEIRSINPAEQQCSRLEILARLRTRDGRILGPHTFIPAAERFGMATVLDRWIIRKAIVEHGHLLKAMDLKLGFNLSAQTLCDPSLWSFVHGVAKDNGTPLSHIAFEITETAAVTCFDTANGFVRRARKHGCTVSLDDFGSGLSSFGYLKRFPINCIKIDGAFVERIVESEIDRAIVAAVVALAGNLGFDVVAEKIENAEILEQLRELGVTHGQGYHLHRPEPLDALIARRLSWSERREPRSRIA
ncbi:EAL domain-containing protein [Hoeflea alexandrii]|uniref:EAL domain-containing protein n=1 Tax=Hoeflea alexandrii TaxID=288436 RepID=UPI0022AF14B9|nr:EAL domain-containing protein [Hoeflea alexandrii]MCZ4289971.1 EAL domain-containing protein [Hoeflea alexandrii]